MKKTVVTAAELALKLRLTDEEYQRICDLLKREPSKDEVILFATIWSDELSNKKVQKWLKTIPIFSENIAKSLDNQEVGYLKINSERLCMMNFSVNNELLPDSPEEGTKLSVHNACQAVYCNGSNPLALLNSLRLGKLTRLEVQNYLKGLVSGISMAALSHGVPIVGGEVFFSKEYNASPLTNILSVGMVEEEKLCKFNSKKGDKIFLIGNPTQFEYFSKPVMHIFDKKKPQLKNNLEIQHQLKQLTLELIHSQIATGVQSVCRAGVFNACLRLTQKIKKGISIIADDFIKKTDFDSITQFLLSETPQRVLIVVNVQKEKNLTELTKKWGIDSQEIGVVEDNQQFTIVQNNKVKLSLKINDLLTGFEQIDYNLPKEKPNYIKQLEKYKIKQIEEPENLREIAWFLINHPNIASKRWIIEQFDSTVGLINISKNFPSDASVLNIRNTEEAIVVGVDCNTRYVHANPYKGAMIAIAEAARNLTCTGAKPMGVSIALNFGNLENPEVVWQFAEVIRGVNKICNKYDLPVISMQTSFNNYSKENNEEVSVYPTPVIGMVGLMDNKKNHLTLPFKNKGDMIFLIGESQNDISASQYLKSYQNVRLSPAPYFDLDKAKQIQEILQELIKLKLVNSAHDVSNGGVFITLVECSLHNQLGFDITSDAEIRQDAFLFGEAQNRVVVSVTPRKEADFIDFMIEKDFPFSTLGHVTKGEMRVDDESIGFITDAKEQYLKAIEKIMND